MSGGGLAAMALEMNQRVVTDHVYATGATTMVPPPPVNAKILHITKDVKDALKTWRSKNGGKPLITSATDGQSAKEMLLRFEHTTTPIAEIHLTKSSVDANPNLKNAPSFQMAVKAPYNQIPKGAYHPMTAPTGGDWLSPTESLCNWASGVFDKHEEALDGQGTSPGRGTPVFDSQELLHLRHIFWMRCMTSWVLLSLLLDGVDGWHLLSKPLRDLAHTRMFHAAPQMYDAGYDPQRSMGQSDGIHLFDIVNAILEQLPVLPRGALATLALCHMLRYGPTQKQDSDRDAQDGQSWTWIQRVANAGQQANAAFRGEELTVNMGWYVVLEARAFDPDSDGPGLPLALLSQIILQQMSTEETKFVLVILTARALYHRAVFLRRQRAEYDDIAKATGENEPGLAPYPPQYEPPVGDTPEAFEAQAKALLDTLANPTLGAKILAWLTMEDWMVAARRIFGANPPPKPPTEEQKKDWALALTAPVNQRTNRADNNRPPSKEEITPKLTDSVFMAQVETARKSTATPCEVCAVLYAAVDRQPLRGNVNHSGNHCRNLASVFNRPPTRPQGPGTGRPDRGGQRGGHGGSRGRGGHHGAGRRNRQGQRPQPAQAAPTSSATAPAPGPAPPAAPAAPAAAGNGPTSPSSYQTSFKKQGRRGKKRKAQADA